MGVVDPLLLTAAAAAVSSSGLLVEKVREVLSSILRRPSKSTVLVRYGNDSYASVDLDEDIRQRLMDAGMRHGLSSEQAARLAQAVLSQLSGIERLDASPDDGDGGTHVK